ncbi:hypothetical protein HGM15179_011619 [Zosterops borbonicus]|uniref:Ig-like domain-containing protein n=1 Tax=Zosterops borbonicus TaxID=364589 RepID=A0A8K1LIV1_9PASS|nr:hypothetical protein HGM15179_011619 [Zosterops borbonicus]
MAIPGVLLTVILLQGGFPGAASDTVTLKEGENLNLHCAFSSPSKSSNSTLQWVNPRGFTIFFNAHRALKDQRYKLLHHSRDELSIQLSNVTVQDSGIYRCFYYSSDFKNKSHNVQILAAPSQPVLEVSQDSGRGIKLSCHTQGCRPQPQISWLLDNGIELQGDTRHRLGADGGKWSTSSTLRILSYSPKVTASCIIQHPALGGHRLVASVPFQDLPSTGCKQPSRISEEGEALSPSENPAVPSSPANSAENPEGSSPSTSPKDPSPSASPKDPEVSSSASPEDPSVPSSAPAQPNPTGVTSNGTEETTTTGNLGDSATSGGFNGAGAAPSGNGTEGEPPRTEVPPAGENTTVIPTFILEQNPEAKGRVRKEKNLLLPVLVAALVLVLLIIVLLFLLKLKKAHGVWKRENDVSEQTLESYKSRSNEDSPGHEKNGQAANPKSNMQYVTEGHGETPEKNPETPEKDLETPEKNPSDKNLSISEKMFYCGRETDV